MTTSATASGTEMTIMGMPANRPASSSGRPGMSQAITSTAGKTVTAANSTPGTRCQLARRRGAGGRSASRAALRSAPVPVALIVATAPGGHALAAPPDPPAPNASLPGEPESSSAVTVRDPVRSSRPLGNRGISRIFGLGRLGGISHLGGLGRVSTPLGVTWLGLISNPGRVSQLVRIQPARPDWPRRHVCPRHRLCQTRGVLGARTHFRGDGKWPRRSAIGICLTHSLPHATATAAPGKATGKSLDDIGW